MWLVFLLLILLSIGIILSSVELKLVNINVSEKKYNFKIIISIKIFSFFKILFFSIDRFGIKIFNKKISIKKFKMKKINKEAFELLKSLNVKLKKVNFNMEVGLVDIFLTNFFIILFSTIFPNLIKGRIKSKNVKYRVLPKYNKFYINFKGKFVISIKLLKLIKFYFKNIKSKNTHNKIKNCNVKESFKYEWTSYRRTYENSDE